MRRIRFTRPALTWLGVALLCCAAPALGQSSPSGARAIARELGYSGTTAYLAHDYVAASQKLEAAYALLPVPTLGLWSARSLDKLGKLLEARARYASVAELQVTRSDGLVQAKAQSDAAADAIALITRIPTLTVQIDGASAAAVTLSVDGSAQPLLAGRPEPLNPGNYRVNAVRGEQHVSADAVLEEGQRATLLLHFDPLPSEPTRPPNAPMAQAKPIAPSREQAIPGVPAPSVMLAGIGALSLAGGAYFAIKASHEYRQLESDCSPHCTSEQSSSVHTQAVVADVLFLSSLAALGGAAWLYFDRGSATQIGRPALGIQPRTGGAELDLRGAF